MTWSLNPPVIGALLAAVWLYVRAVRILAGRGVTIPRRQQTAFYGAMLLTATALISPVDALGEDLLSAHMAQHLLIADLAAPLALAGLRWPLHVFFLPRPVLVAFARRRRLRHLLAVLCRPLVAIPIYILVLYGWHLAPLFEAAVNNDVVHAIQHQSFVLISVLVWWSAIEPNHRRLRGELWKVGHILGARLAGMMLGMAFIAIRVPVYTGAYPAGERRFGLSAVADQQTAGALMLSLDFFVVLFALSFFFWRASQDDLARQNATIPGASAKPSPGAREQAPQRQRVVAGSSGDGDR